MAQAKEVISTINGLIETLKDGEKGFKEAADAVKDPQLKNLFREYSQQRNRFASELQSQAQALGESKPETTSSAAGAMHRAWINLKSAVTSDKLAAKVLRQPCAKAGTKTLPDVRKSQPNSKPKTMHHITIRGIPAASCPG